MDLLKNRNAMIRHRLVSALLPVLLLAACTAEESRQPSSEAQAPAAAASTVASVEQASLGSIPNLSRAGNLFFAGQPNSDDLGLLEGAGITTVINLRHPAELGGFDEGAAVRDLGLSYESLPWNGPDELTDDVFEATRALLREVDSPTLFHCGSANRVGAVWLPFRVLDQGVDLEQAVAEARQVGMRTPEYEALARDYIARNR